MANRYLRSSCEGLKKKASCDSMAKKTCLYHTKSHIQISLIDKSKSSFSSVDSKQKFTKKQTNLSSNRIDMKDIQSDNKKTGFVIFKKNSLNKITEKIKHFQSHRIKYFDKKHNENVIRKGNCLQNLQSNLQKNSLISLHQNLETNSQRSNQNTGDTLRNSCYIDKSTLRETLSTEPKKKLSLMSYGHRKDNRNKKCYSISNRIDKYQIKATKCQSLSLLSLLLTKKQLSSKNLMQSTLTRLLIKNPHKTLQNRLKETKKKQNLKVKHQELILQSNECQISIKGIKIPINSYEFNQTMNQSINKH